MIYTRRTRLEYEYVHAVRVYNIETLYRVRARDKRVVNRNRRHGAQRISCYRVCVPLIMTTITY